MKNKRNIFKEKIKSLKTEFNNTIINSLKFLDLISDDILSKIDEEDISFTPYDTIIFEWIVDKNFISVEIGKDHLGFFSELNEDNFIIDKIIFDNKIPDELNLAFDNFLKLKYDK